MEGKLLSDANEGDILESADRLRGRVLQRMFYASSITVEVVPLRPITAKEKVIDG